MLARKSTLPMLWVTVLLGVLAPIPAESQLASVVISGTVTDQTVSLVPKAAVIVRNVETGIVRSLTTDDTGRF